MALKNRTRLGNVTCDNKLLDIFRQLHEQTKIPLSALMDEAVADLVQKYEAKGWFQRQDDANANP